MRDQLGCLQCWPEGIYLGNNQEVSFFGRWSHDGFGFQFFSSFCIICQLDEGKPHSLRFGLFISIIYPRDPIFVEVPD